MSRNSLAIKERVQRYGLRAYCFGCRRMSRHYPGQGARLRSSSCPHCEMPGFLVAWWWVLRYPDKAEQKAKQCEAVARALNPHGRQ